MTHHKRRGGRTVELIVLFVLICLSVLLVMGGGYLGAHMGPSRGVIVGALVGFALSGLLWKAFWDFYRYDRDTLRPIKEEEEK